MLTLDSEQLVKQRKVSRFLEKQHQDRELIRANIAAKEHTVANDGDLITTELSAQWGTPMTSVQLFDKLKKLNPNLIYEHTKNNDRLAGIYRMKETVDGAGYVRLQKVLVCGMERNFMPERSVRVPKIERVATAEGWEDVKTFSHEIRGWRTVLHKLLTAGLITLTQIEKAFPISDGNSRNWQHLTT